MRSGYSKSQAFFLALFLLLPSTITLADNGTRTTSNLCRNCHGGNYGDYVTLSQFSVPSEVSEGSVFIVSVKMTLSGNLGQSQSHYWEVDTDVTLSSAQNRFSFSPATYSHVNLVPGDTIDIFWELTADNGVGLDTLQVDLFAQAQHFGRTGTDQLNSGIEVTSPNTPPVLSANSFSPIEGNMNQFFHFEVLWTDLDEDMPADIKVFVDGSPHSMSPIDQYSETPSTGMRFASSNMNLGVGFHTYYFQASDGISTARLPASNEQISTPQGELTGEYLGPFVGGGPILSGGALNPLVGDAQTIFTYSIVLEPGDDFAGTNVTFWLNGIASQLSPVITNVGGTGSYYNFSTQLSSGVNHIHYFTAENRFGNTRFPLGSETLSGPIIVGDVLSSASIIPTQADDRTPFTFSINYSNPASLPPTAMDVYIDNISYPLNVSSSLPDWSMDNRFSTELLLSAGTHSYYFFAEEGERAHRIPESGVLQVSVTRFDSDPWLSNGSAIINDEDIFNSTSITYATNLENISKPLLMLGESVEVRVTFYDAENDESAQNSIIAWVNGVPRNMVRLDTNSPSDGQVWSYLIEDLGVGNNHSVYFTATSSYAASGVGTGVSAVWPIEIGSILPLPDIRAPNIPPQIRPPSNGGLTLEPFSGSISDNYTFMIEVVDLDWTPETPLSVWLQFDGIIYQLTPLNETDYQNGSIYTITLNAIVGSHQFSFGVSDAEDESVYPANENLKGPIVQANLIPASEIGNQVDFISWAWWLVSANVILIIGGLSWGLQIFVDARESVHQKTLRTKRQSIEKSSPGEKIANESQANTPQQIYANQQPKYHQLWQSDTLEQSNYSWSIESSVDTDELLAELGFMDQTDDPLPTSQAPEPVVEQIPIPVIETPTPSDDPPASPPSPLSPSPQSHSSTSTGNEQKQDEINEILDDILGERF
ncbi:MAG: hypothetical protein HOB52_04650 [Euryarchaeota archaeon]|jgi:hypothetical protein|nr:hypothetical protein [Euryarchaeota archaeon]MBT6645072.1 hypothetical protein [Euryarchaeota archaeon]